MNIYEYNMNIYGYINIFCAFMRICGSYEHLRTFSRTVQVIVCSGEWPESFIPRFSSNPEEKNACKNIVETLHNEPFLVGVICEVFSVQGVTYQLYCF